ncbi:MAG: acyl-ACP desaturase [Acidobacteriota bacterium]
MNENVRRTTPPEAPRDGAPPFAPVFPSVSIDAARLRERYRRFEEGARRIRWDDQGPVRVDWSLFDRDRLTLDNLFVVKLVTFVESYADVYADLLIARFCTSETMAAFFRLWEREEQNHADRLVAYLELVGLDRAALRAALERPRQRGFEVDYIRTPLQANAFTYCQELLTAFFYQAFRRTVGEPLLDLLLTKIIADEWRHFHWYEYVLRLHLEADRARTLQEVGVVFENFSMPGNQILGPDYEILTDEIVRQMRFGMGDVFQIGKKISSTFGLIDGGRLMAHSSYARDIKEICFRRKPPKERHDEVVRAFTADLKAALATGGP